MQHYIRAVRQWPKGIRFYIALISIVLTAEVYFSLHSIYGNSGTTIIRTQQTYAWISLTLIILALAIGPACKSFKWLPGTSLLRDARRMIGISAAWFAAWHVGISYIDQFHAANPFALPPKYQLAFLLGITALLILLAMALTSFDAAFKGMGIWWFRLHRLLYASVILILLHAFMIGSHALTLPFFVGMFIALTVLFALQVYLGFGPGKEPTMLKSITVVYGIVLVLATFAFGFHERAVFRATNMPNNGLQYETR